MSFAIQNPPDLRRQSFICKLVICRCLVVAEMADLNVLTQIFIAPAVMSKAEMVFAGIDQSLSQLYHEHNCKNCQTGLPAEVERFLELVSDLT